MCTSKGRRAVVPLPLGGWMETADVGARRGLTSIGSATYSLLSDPSTKVVGVGRRPTWSGPGLLRTGVAVFRRKGCAHTSVQDLQQATGLHPGSLYKAYGSKEGLFAAALAAYNEQVTARRVGTHLDEADPPLRGLHTFFTSTFDSGEETNPGCLLTNTAIEAPALPGTGRDGVTAGLALIEGGFRRLLDRAVAAGDLA